ncbi:hypothetical protein M413DRAFT_443391 [Hebeloma cylindrosporum]|uniref:F-box domain-containing protein n=1 Tax=Hebeloma cylindrosporum TaxID=76867 RepID=A0A0C2Y0R4_HEBCY|nr:hypothetical protein M413DRAFT_443391 [Hebeloma cylindrosporum h7]
MTLQPAGGPRLTLQLFPVEIINIIFIYTLPDDALDHEQPDIRVSPMLLCHVCSRWRSIALRLPALWANLYHLVRLSKHREQESGSIAMGGYPISLEFLKWWSCNLGPNHPFQFRFYTMDDDADFFQEPTFVTLFNLAQHLDIKNDTAWRIRNDSRRESPMLTFPHLESLRIPHEAGFPQSITDIFPLRPKHPILKLHMQRFHLEHDDVFEHPPIPWSSLTHLVFDAVYLFTFTWFDLIRSCVNLQSGYFHLRLPRLEDPDAAYPSQFTHCELRELVIRLDDYYPRNIGQDLLQNLSLPCLTSFRLSARLTTQGLYCVLESMPPFINLYWIAGNSIWFRAFDDDEHILQIHSRTAPRHPRQRPDKFVSVYRKADDPIFRQSLFVELIAVGRAHEQFP